VYTTVWVGFIGWFVRRDHGLLEAAPYPNNVAKYRYRIIE
jgi:hypothetical protein